jgi:hypothetical protein
MRDMEEVGAAESEMEFEMDVMEYDKLVLCEDDSTKFDTNFDTKTTPCPANSVAPVASSTMSACKCLPGFIEAGDGTCDKVCAPGYEPLLQETCVGCNVCIQLLVMNQILLKDKCKPL